MKTVEITVYNFDELTDTAKEKAREWYRDGLEYPWWGDVRKSLNDFAGYFGVRIIEWSLGCGSGRDLPRLRLPVGESRARREGCGERHRLHRASLEGARDGGEQGRGQAPRHRGRGPRAPFDRGIR